MQKRRLAILDMYNNFPNQGMRCIKEIVERYDKVMSYSRFDVRGQAELPGMDHDIYICSGGPGDPRAGDGEWDTAFYDWLGQMTEWNKTSTSKKYVFFICHSFQMAMRFFDLGQVLPRQSMSFGTFPVHLTNAGLSDPTFRGLSNPFHVADFRRYQVVHPHLERFRDLGADILALEKVRPHVPLERAIMAVRFSPEMIGTQFHPEADPHGMSLHFRILERRNEIIAEHGEDKYMSMMADLREPHKIEATHRLVLPQFLENSLTKLGVEIRPMV